MDIFFIGSVSSHTVDIVVIVDESHLGEERRVVVDVLQVDLHVGVPDEAVAAIILCEDGESPLRPATRLVTIEWLKRIDILKFYFDNE